MNIALCTGWSTEKDGIADYSRYLADGLRKAGCAIKVVPLGDYIGDEGYYRKAAEEANKADLCHVQFNYVYFNGELPYRNRFLCFAKHLKKPFVMTVHEVRIGFSTGLSGFSSRLKAFVFNSTMPLWDRWSIACHRKMYDRADRIIVHTGAHRDAVAALVRESKKVVLIPHGIPQVSDADRNVAAADAKKTLGVQDKTVMAIFGFINSRKGYECAIEALTGLPESVVLLIAGGIMTERKEDRAYYDKLTGLISAKGLIDRVKVTGYLSGKDIPAVMAATDICLAPFSSTAASGALSLSIGYHKPIIASDIGVHKEINARVKCLELFDQDDAAHLSETIRALAGDRDRMRVLSGATAMYAERYSYANIAKDTAQLYERVLTRR